MFKGICIKQKSMLFMLILISILLSTLYFQNRASHKNYLQQLEDSYKSSFDNYYKIFTLNQIKEYELFTSLIQDDPSFKTALFEKHSDLKQIQYVPTVSQQQKNAFEKGTLIGYEIGPESIYYKILVPIKSKGKVGSYMQYLIDTRAFLRSIKKYDGSNGIIYVLDDNKENDVFLKEYSNEGPFKQIAQSCELISEPVFEVQGGFYVKKTLTLANYDGKKVANAVFFLDVTKEKKEFISSVQTSIVTTIILFIFAAIVVNYFFNYLVKQIQKKENELKQINKNLEEMVEHETNRRVNIEQEALQHKQKSEQLLLHQSKLALLGEMIGNIAHQWRQPLMQLSAILMYLDAYNEKKKLTPEKFSKKLEEGNVLIDFMSKTIEDFRNYYKPEKQKEQFEIKQSIEGALFIVHSSLKHFNIQINVQYEDEKLSITSFKNEFSQALLNIITNAKDILIQREIGTPKIDIQVLKNQNMLRIEVQDNAGGVPEDIIEKVFDPYFTTKHKSQGTGIGLYMTKMIIENNMGGKIWVENVKSGAKFIIELESN